MKTKTCFKCSKTKPLFEFYLHKQMVDGHVNKCKVCARRESSDHREANLEEIRAYDRGRNSLAHRVEARKIYNKEYRKRFPLRYAANSAVSNALRSGLLIRPCSCQICGAKGRVEGHHDDYNKPLEVLWLCTPCHRRLDRDLRKAGNIHKLQGLA